MHVLLSDNVFIYTHHFIAIIPREARAEGPSVARLINQSGRRPERSESRANSSEKYIYIHIYSVVLISVKQCSIHGSRAKYMAKKKDK